MTSARPAGLAQRNWPPEAGPNAFLAGYRPVPESAGNLRTILLMLSIMCTGMRMVRAWSAIERVTACRIHHVA